MTKREAAVVSAYTGCLVGEFRDLHTYIEEKMGHPVWTHEMTTQGFSDKLRDSARDDFMAIEVTE